MSVLMKKGSGFSAALSRNLSMDLIYRSKPPTVVPRSPIDSISDHMSSHKMDRSTPLKPNPIMEKLRADQGRMEDLAKSYLAGLEHLGQENILLASQLAEQESRFASMMNEMNVYYMASTEAQGKLEGSLRVSNELWAELQRYKIFNTQLRQQYDEARGTVLKLRVQLDAAQEEVDRLKIRVEGMGKSSQLPISIPSDYSRLWPLGTANEPPTPPLATEDVSECPRTHQRGHAVPNRSPETENQRSTQIASPYRGADFFGPADPYNFKATAGPSRNHKYAATAKLKTKGVPRGGSHVDESFARIENNLARQSPPTSFVVYPVQTSVVASKTNISNPGRASPAPNDPHVSPSLREFSWPHATFIQDGKETLNPECVPFVPPTAKGRLVSKLNPLSQDFIPAMSQPKRSVTPPHKRLVKIHPKSKDTISDDSTRTATFDSSSQPVALKIDTAHDGSKPVPATRSANIDSTTVTTVNSSKPQITSADSSMTPDGYSKVTDEGMTAKTAKPIPPHLRGLPPKSVAPNVVAAATLTTPSTQATADEFSQVTTITPPEAATMEAWLDDLEKQSMGQSAPGERSNPTLSASSSSDKLIDLDAEDVGNRSNAESVPGFTLDAMQDLLGKSRAASPTVSSEYRTLSSLLAKIQSLPAKAEDKSDLTTSLHGLLVEGRNRQNVHTDLQKSQGTLEDEGYLTASPEDPYLTHVSRGLTSRLETSTGSTAICRREAGTGTSDNQVAGADIEDERVPEFKAKLPAPENENHITADFLAAYNSKLLGVQSKYGTSMRSQAGGPAFYHKDQYLDPDYVAPKIVGTRRLGELLDPSSKLMILNETPSSRGQDMKVRLEWKPVMKDGKKVFVL